MLILQLTGLSGAGKSTLAFALKKSLDEKGLAAEVIDGDVYRQTTCKDLGFSAADRKENMRRLAGVARGFCQRGIIAIIAAINPYEEIRKEISETFGAKIIWVRCNLQILLQRDPKGLYQKAFLPDNHPQKIRNLTGINDPYEMPANPDLVIDTGVMNVTECGHCLLRFVLSSLDAGR